MDATYLRNTTQQSRGGSIPLYLVLYILFALILTVAYFVSPALSTYLATAFVVLYLIFDAENGLFFWVACSYFIYVLDTDCFAIISGALIITLLFRMLIRHERLRFSYIMAIVVSAASIAISYAFGYQPKIISALMTIFNVVLFFLLLTTFNRSSYVVRLIEAFWVMAFLFVGITIIEIARSGLDLSLRLQFDDNVRDMANSVVVAVYFWIANTLIHEKFRMAFHSGFMQVTGLFAAGLLLLTLAKGPIFAMVFGIAAYGFLEGKIKKVWRFLIVFLLIILVLQFTGTVNFIRFLQRNYDLNGRTNIWLFYTKKLFARGWKGVLFGFGPGNLKRIAPNEYLGKYYAHSVILDYFFSYGLCGFALFLLLIFVLFRKAYAAKNHLGIGLLAMTFLSYLVSGAATNTQVYILFFLTHLITLGEQEAKKNRSNNDEG